MFFLETELDIKQMMDIERADRLGGARNDQAGQKRPIIVRFLNNYDTEMILQSAYTLSGTPFGVDRDYPREIAEARKRLFQVTDARYAREDRFNVQIRYPARLYVKGRLVKDCSPDWFTLLKESRVEGFQIEKTYNCIMYSKDTEIDMSVHNRVITSPAEEHALSKNVNNQPRDISSKPVNNETRDTLKITPGKSDANTLINERNSLTCQEN